ncbi:hypothetical protein FOZ62_001880, partial [Perkinsus olseni]
QSSICCLLVIRHSAQILIGADRINTALEPFRYKKKYDSDEQYQVAKNAFAQSMKIVAELRANGDITHEVDVNEHSDLPREVFNQILHCVPDPKPSPSLRASNFTDTDDTPIKAPPASVDWEAAGALAPVRDQSTFLNSCGSCYAIGAAVVMESHFKIQTGIAKVVPFSVQQIVDCSQAYNNHGCNGGTPDKAYAYCGVQGIVKASSYPYKAKLGTCKTSVTTDPRKQCLKRGDITHVVTVPAADETAMLRNVAKGPVAVSIYAGAPPFEYYKSGIITAKTCGVSNVDHTVIIVGYNTSSTGVPYWKIMNTWGKSWGMKGFAYVERTGNQPGPCNILVDANKYPIYGNTVKSSVCA